MTCEIVLISNAHSVPITSKNTQTRFCNGTDLSVHLKLKQTSCCPIGLGIALRPRSTDFCAAKKHIRKSIGCGVCTWINNTWVDLTTSETLKPGSFQWNLGFYWFLIEKCARFLSTSRHSLCREAYPGCYWAHSRPGHATVIVLCAWVSINSTNLRAWGLED